MESICKLKNVYKALYHFEKRFAEENGITINEGILLCCLKDGNAHTASEIHDYLGLSKSRASRVITDTEKKGYIKREIGNCDKRQMFFSLNRQGVLKINEIRSRDNDFSELKEQINLLD